MTATLDIDFPATLLLHAKDAAFLRRNLQTLTNTKTSPMPTGLLGGLTARQIADLLAFVRQAQ